MKVITLSKEEFDEYSWNHRYETYMQNSKYAELESCKGFGTHYLGFEENGELVGATMCLYKKAFWGYSYAYAPRGILMDYDNPYMVNKISTSLKKLLYKQNFIFMKIDPPVIASERDITGKTLYTSNTVNEILKTLKSNDYVHQGFNLGFEMKKPRWNNVIRLETDIRDIFNNYDDNTKLNIKNASNLGVSLIRDEDLNASDFFGLIRDKYSKIGEDYFKKLFEIFNDKIEVYYLYLDTNLYTKNANNMYNKEEERNIALADIIENNKKGYDIQKVINDKMQSDKELNDLKKSVILSTEYLSHYPNGKILASTLVVPHKRGVDCLILHTGDKEKINPLPLLVFKLSETFGNRGLKYLNLGPAVGTFNLKDPRYQELSKYKGLNSNIVEYIGEFDLVINKFMYKIYLRKLEKEKKNKEKKKK